MLPSEPAGGPGPRADDEWRLLTQLNAGVCPWSPAPPCPVSDCLSDCLEIASSAGNVFTFSLNEGSKAVGVFYVLRVLPLAARGSEERPGCSMVPRPHTHHGLEWLLLLLQPWKQLMVAAGVRERLQSHSYYITGERETLLPSQSAVLTGCFMEPVVNFLHPNVSSSD